MDAPANNSSNVKTRVLTAIPLIAGFLLALYLAPSLLWAVLMTSALFIAGHEWAGLAKLSKVSAWAYAALIGLATLGLGLWSHDSPLPYYPALAFWLLAPVLLERGVSLRSRPLLLLLGLFVLIPAGLAMIELREQSPDLLLVVVGVVVIADSAAYFSGRRFGRHKLAPGISPGKTWEGVVGAGLAVTLYALAVHFTWPKTCGLQCLPQVLAAFWVLFGLSVLGDLFESWLKRQAGVKDSGSVLPGHGGVLDRIDSLSAVLPAAALFWMWLK